MNGSAPTNTDLCIAAGLLALEAAFSLVLGLDLARTAILSAVRMALQLLLVGLVLRDVGRLAGVGIVLGTAAAVVAARGVAALLYGVAPLTPLPYLLAAAALLAAALGAALGPARRAGRVSPARALAAE